MFDRTSRSKELSVKTLAKWIYEQNIIDYIYKVVRHSELISKSSDLLSGLAKNSMLSEETLLLIWKTCTNEHKHEAVTESILSVISNIASSLPIEMINFIIESIHKLPIQTLGSYSTYFNTFYLNSLSVFRAGYGKGNAEKSSSTSTFIGKQFKTKQNYQIKWSCRLLTCSSNWWMCLTILIHLSLWRKQSKVLNKAFHRSSEWSWSKRYCRHEQDEAILLLSNKVDLILLAIKSAEVYLKFARSNSPMDGNNIETTIFRGSLNHRDTILKYFDFISLLLKNDAHNKLSNQHVDLMLEVFVQESIWAHERSCFYRFFTYTDENWYNHDDRNFITLKIREHLLQNILCKY